ncbi:MAG: putative sulfate exporter family transporter [Verrucomicrobia bacterium]|nr:putative sulfate exporter family transporter [Verrucomicrobiota bacterium]
MSNEQSTPATASQPRWWQSEDWLAVGIGFLLIGLVLAGLRPELPQFAWKNGGELLPKVFAASNLAKSLVLGLGLLSFATAGVVLMRGAVGRFIAGFPVVFGLAWLSQLIAGNARVNGLGLEYVIFALLLGLALNHALTLPDWLREAVRTEFYIKTGLVILGAGILFEEILQAGALGLAEAVLVVTVVWYLCFWLARRLRVDDEFGVMLSTAVSICGVSAAIAACGAIQGDRKKLSYVTSLVLIVALPMMVLMPWAVKQFAIPELVGGAWLGGTLDTSGSVVAAGALISEPAMKTGVIVKFSQNVLIGVAAFLLSIWWTLRSGAANSEKASAKVIWERFPKFVLGFIVASLVFSFLLDPALVKETKKLLTGLRTWWFAMAFVCIGLETRFTELVRMEGGRPVLAFLGAQAFNVIWTLILAYLLFGGLLFSVPQIR